MPIFFLLRQVVVVRLDTFLRVLPPAREARVVGLGGAALYEEARVVDRARFPLPPVCRVPSFSSPNSEADDAHLDQLLDSVAFACSCSDGGQLPGLDVRDDTRLSG